MCSSALLSAIVLLWNFMEYLRALFFSLFIFHLLAKLRAVVNDTQLYVPMKADDQLRGMLGCCEKLSVN